MARPKPPFSPSKKGFKINLDADERDLLRRLLGELSELLTTAPIGDPRMARLFPPAYFDDEVADTEYQRLMREELVASRLHSIATVDEFLSDSTVKDLTFAQLDAFCAALNAVRLILGTLLDVGEDDNEAVDFDDPRQADLALYNFLSWLLDRAISALTQNIL